MLAWCAQPSVGSCDSCYGNVSSSGSIACCLVLVSAVLQTLTVNACSGRLTKRRDAAAKQYCKEMLNDEATGIKHVLRRCKRYYPVCSGHAMLQSSKLLLFHTICRRVPYQLSVKGSTLCTPQTCQAPQSTDQTGMSSLSTLSVEPCTVASVLQIVPIRDHLAHVQSAFAQHTGHT